MRFVDFLKATVLLCAGSATLLAALTIIGGARMEEQVNTLIAVCWWAAAAVIGAWIGRHHAASPPIARLLADAKMQTALPEPRPGLTLVNRLWPLLIATIAAAALSFWLPQVAGVAAGVAVPEGARPDFGSVWRIGAAEGPHAAPEFFTEEDIHDFYAADWKVHFNSARTGVRLVGPKPRWARTDGGEAGE